MSDPTVHVGALDLRADCARCVGLCCVAPAFARSADFAIDKPAGVPCPNLAGDSRCTIHDELRPRGFAGCVVYDCFGAGQQVARRAGGQDWRTLPDGGREMFAVFAVVRPLHELLWYVAAALAMPAAAPVHPDLRRAAASIDGLTRAATADLLALDLDAVRAEVNPLLLRASELVRGAGPGLGTNLRGADLLGTSLPGADLRGATLRGALLVGADLRDADLREADVIGADLRGADLRGADLTGALFLTESQLESARGDARTRVSPPLTPPAHWTTVSRAVPVPAPRRRRPGRPSGPPA